MTEETIRVEVAYATPERQWLIEVDVAPGTTAFEAIELSGITGICPGIDTTNIGVFGEPVEKKYRLAPGDRVEIYRPLIIDPKEARRETARRGR